MNSITIDTQFLHFLFWSIIVLLGLFLYTLVAIALIQWILFVHKLSEMKFEASSWTDTASMIGKVMQMFDDASSVVNDMNQVHNQ